MFGACERAGSDHLPSPLRSLCGASADAARKLSRSLRDLTKKHCSFPLLDQNKAVKDTPNGRVTLIFAGPFGSLYGCFAIAPVHGRSMLTAAKGTEVAEH